MTEAESPKKQNRATSGIDKIESAPFAPAAERGWVTILQKFNPLGALAEAYGKTIAYRLECKRIDAEIERVHTQAGVVHTAIEKSFLLNMEALQHRRIAINRYFDTVQGELGQHHVERMTVLKMAETVTMHMLTPGLTLEERQNCKEMATALTAQIPLFGDRANQSLQTLVSALPQVKLPEQLMLPS
jgi:hypothetical protein